MTSKIVLIDNGEGSEPSPYIRYSARLPVFLEKFPISAGFRVETQVTDFLSVAPGLLELLREIIRAGRAPETLGLPNLGQLLTTIICTSRLYAPHGAHPLRSASALAAILAPKDFEALETAANQRLLASVGIGGTVFDDDENYDIARRLPSDLRPPAALNGPAVTGAQAAPDVPSAALASAKGSSAAAGPSLPENGVSVPANKAGDASATKAPTKGQVVQLQQLASRVGEQPPECLTREDAELQLTRLGALAQEQARLAGANGSEPHA